MTLGRCQTDVANPSDSATSRFYRAVAADAEEE
jgi:hypothetical protein